MRFATYHHDERQRVGVLDQANPPHSVHAATLIDVLDDLPTAGADALDRPPGPHVPTVRLPASLPPSTAHDFVTFKLQPYRDTDGPLRLALPVERIGRISTVVTGPEVRPLPRARRRPLPRP